jgi:hypothetical protein
LALLAITAISLVWLHLVVRAQSARESAAMVEAPNDGLPVAAPMPILNAEEATSPSAA